MGNAFDIIKAVDFRIKLGYNTSTKNSE
jgi:hypothetical protein